jgi:hypothetical protein
MPARKWRRIAVTRKVGDDKRSLSRQRCEPATELLGGAEKAMAQYERRTMSSDEVPDTPPLYLRKALVQGPHAFSALSVVVLIPLFYPYLASAIASVVAAWALQAVSMRCE